MRLILLATLALAACDRVPEPDPAGDNVAVIVANGIDPKHVTVTESPDCWEANAFACEQLAKKLRNPDAVVAEQSNAAEAALAQ